MKDIAYLGIALGMGIAGFFVGKMYAERKNEDRVQKEIDDARAHYEKREAEETDSVAESPTQDENEFERPVEVAPEARLVELGYMRPENVMPKPEESPSETIRPEEDVQERVFQELVAKRDPSRPYVISQDEYMDDESEFADWDQIEYVFWDKDHVLTTENNNVIDNPTQMIGHDAIKHFGLKSTSDDTVHVLNIPLECKIEIIRDRRSYNETIL